MKKNNIAFIGAGFQATTNILPAAKIAGINITALCTRNIEGAREALMNLGSAGKAYEDYHKMLSHESFDGVVVVAQPEDQFRIALACLNKGKSVFVEKPLGWNQHEAETIAQAAKDNKAKVMVGFMKRFAPSYKKIKALIEDQSLGKARSFYLNFCVDGTPFCPDEASFIKLAAIHVIDLILYLFGDIEALSVMNNSEGPSINMCLSVKTKEGVVGSLNLSSMSAWTRESENLTVTFEKGFALVEEINKVVIHENKAEKGLAYATLSETDKVYTPCMTPMSGGERDLYLRGFVGELQYFTHLLEAENGSDSDGRSNVSTMKLCDLILNQI